MPLFNLKSGKLSLVRQKNFKNEKELQKVIEKNLDTIFSCQFVASEYSTGEKHGGRIDTLALSEDKNPVIIEYKKKESSDLLNQSLFYLSWIQDHQGDFQVAVNKQLGKDIEVEWSDVRVICIAPGFKKYDLHAVQMMGANIELWQYRLYDNGDIYLEEVFRKSEALSSEVGGIKSPKMMSAGQKAALSRKTGSYTIEQHLKKGSKKINRLVEEIRDFINMLGEDVEESPKKFYIAYKIAQNFACLEVHKSKILLYLKLDPAKIEPIPENGRDVRKIGHYGTGDFELSIFKKDQLEQTYSFIKMAYERVGG